MYSQTRRAVDLGMGEPFESALTAPFPGLLFIGDHVGHLVAEITFIVKKLQITIIGIFDRSLPRRGFLARAENPFCLLIRAGHHVDVVFDAEHALFDPIAHQFSLLIAERLCPSRKCRVVAEFDLFALRQPHQTEESALRHEDLAAGIFIATVLMNRERRYHEHVVGPEGISFAVVDLPAATTETEQSRRADVTVRATRRRMGPNV